MKQSNTLGDGSGAAAARDSRLEGFAEGGRFGAALPSAVVAGVLEDVADGTGRPPPGATDDEVIGMLASWQALEAHANARMLAVLRELIRRRPADDGVPAQYPGDLPGSWDKGAAYEAAAELGISWQSAVPLMHLAWEMEARLPGIGRQLDDGVITGLKARIISDELAALDDEKAAEAEKLLLDHDLGAASMTPGKLRKLGQRIADTVDPEGARQRREDGQRERARVSFFRAHGGDTTLFAEGLPADEALMAQQGIQARALAYREAGLYPDVSMDCLRVLGMLDLVNQVTVDARAARYRADEGADPQEPAPDPGPSDGNASGGVPGSAREPGLPSLVNLTLPLATLLGLADRPGEVPGFGSVDPGLVRDLGAAAAGSNRTRFCFTLTNRDGHAVGHACARRIRTTGKPRTSPGRAGNAGPVRGSWNLEPDGTRSGPDGGYGAWLLSVPGGARYRLDVHPVPLDHCDHRFATDTYRPGALLRHLVEIRDGECVSVSCSHPARSCDYEHATPWDKNGVTDACNAGPVSRSCHQVKQKQGWGLSNPEPAIHRWSTPSGRTYDKGPKTYPA